MKRDATGRFQRRPYWDIEELERLSERTITSFLIERYGFERIPVPTEALTVLIEREASDLDLSAELSDHKYDVFGVTDFERGRKPRVRIARELWEQNWRVNRLRTTLAHEYGHVMLHTWLYDQADALAGLQTCYWQSLLPKGGVVDWMEWQAGYVSGALLMPESFTRRSVAAFLRNRSTKSPVGENSRAAIELQQHVALTFEVSTEAAAVRLSQLGYLTN